MAVRRAALAVFIGAAAVLWLGLRAPVNAERIDIGSEAPAVSVERSRTLFAAGDSRQQAERSVGRPLPTASYRAGDLLRDIHRLVVLRDQSGSSAELQRHAESIYRALLAAGTAAVPEALDFLESGDDLTLAGQPGASFDFQSLRLVLIDALRQIGGRDVEVALLKQLQLTASNAELEALADALEWLQPGAYSAVILDQAMARLAELTSGSASTAAQDPAPLFRIVQDYGQDEMAPLLQGAPYWLRGYADVVLANLPNGGGIESLTQAARRDLRRSGNHRALHLLAQLAATEPRAEQALLDLAAAGEIPDSAWTLITDVLIGDRHLQLEEPPLDPRLIGSLRGSNPFSVHSIVDRQEQLIYSVNYSAVLSAEAVAARLALLDRVLEEALSPGARTALWAARDLLNDAY